eukprot:bmy_15962T0
MLEDQGLDQMLQHRCALAQSKSASEESQNIKKTYSSKLSISSQRRKKGGFGGGCDARVNAPPTFESFLLFEGKKKITINKDTKEKTQLWAEAEVTSKQMDHQFSGGCGPVPKPLRGLISGLAQRPRFLSEKIVRIQIKQMQIHYLGDAEDSLYSSPTFWLRGVCSLYPPRLTPKTLPAGVQHSKLPNCRLAAESLFPSPGIVPVGALILKGRGLREQLGMPTLLSYPGPLTFRLLFSLRGGVGGSPWGVPDPHSPDAAGGRRRSSSSGGASPPSRRSTAGALRRAGLIARGDGDPASGLRGL